jgi:hypothetical protein
MTRFSYGASLQANKVSERSTEAMHRDHRDCTHIAQLHVSIFFSKGVTYPATSRVISRTKAVRLDRKPFLLEILGAGVLGVTSVIELACIRGFSYFCCLVSRDGVERFERR